MLIANSWAGLQPSTCGAAECFTLPRPTYPLLALFEFADNLKSILAGLQGHVIEI